MARVSGVTSDFRPARIVSQDVRTKIVRTFIVLGCFGEGEDGS